MADIKNACDFLSACAAAASFTDHLPTIAALASLVWTILRMSEWTTKKWRRYRSGKAN